MSLEAKKSIIPVHAATVITHIYKARPAAEEFHPDFSGGSVKAILNQFFDQRGRAFNDFPCRNLAGDLIRQQTNLSLIRNGAAVAKSLQQKPKNSEAQFAGARLGRGPRKGYLKLSTIFGGFLAHPFDFIPIRL